MAQKQLQAVQQVRVLHNIWQEPAFLLVITAAGYQIQQTNGKIWEYSDTCPDYLHEMTHYGGPENYFCQIGQQLFDVRSGEKVDPIGALQQLRKNVRQSLPWDTRDTGEWVGLAGAAFAPYRSWRATGQLCGSYAAAVMLAYYQDQVAPDFAPEKIRVPHGEGRRLIETLAHEIQPRGYSTIPVQVAMGINRLYQKYDLPHQAEFWHLGGWSQLTKRLAQGQPVVTGLLKILGSSYGNHWVTAYAYLVKDGERFLKVHDNWGNHQKVITADWLNGLVYLKK